MRVFNFQFTSNNNIILQILYGRQITTDCNFNRQANEILLSINYNVKRFVVSVLFVMILSNLVTLSPKLYYAMARIQTVHLHKEM